MGTILVYIFNHDTQCLSPKKIMTSAKQLSQIHLHCLCHLGQGVSLGLKYQLVQTRWHILHSGAVSRADWIYPHPLKGGKVP